MWSAHSSHELIGDGFQELGLVVLGADEVSRAGSSRLEADRQIMSKHHRHVSTQVLQEL